MIVCSYYSKIRFVWLFKTFSDVFREVRGVSSHPRGIFFFVLIIFNQFKKKKKKTYCLLITDKTYYLCSNKKESIKRIVYRFTYRMYTG